MSNERETSEVIMAVQKAAFLMDPFFKLTMVGTVFLITYFARLAKEGRLNKNEFYNIQEFFKATEGNYSIANIPYDKNYSPWKVVEHQADGKTDYTVENRVTGEVFLDNSGEPKSWGSRIKAERMMENLNKKENLALDELKDLGVRHVILPDLNADDGMVQIAIYDEDKEKFVGWQERYLLNRMRGGEHDVRDLRNLTNGNTSLISIPVEGAELETMQKDFGELRINYAILPDLNVGDGETQLIVANSDINNVEFWFSMYNQDLIQRGEEPKEMKKMSMEAYTKTGNLTEEQYADTASEELKAVNEKYETKEPGIVEQTVGNQEKGIRSVNSEAYETFASDNGYVQLSIDKATLVDNSKFANVQSIKDNGLFACRIPGTFAEHEQTLVLPESQVFTFNCGKTYRAFVKKDDKSVVMGPDGDKIPVENRLNGEQLRKSHFDPVEQERRKKEKELKDIKVKNFNNFERRNYDMDTLEQALLNVRK